MMRKSVRAGSFYPRSESRLRDMLDSFFDSLGGLPEPLTPATIGGLVPHAGYVYSGKVAAYTYKEMKKQLPHTFVVIGPNHTRLGSQVAIMTEGGWETPLGIMDIDTELATKIFKECEILDDDSTAHLQEHSIEVQLPFIQYIGGKKFVPISLGMQDAETAKEVGAAIADAVQSLSPSPSVGIVASSDLTHFGAAYGFMPTRQDPLEWMKEIDGKILSGIEKMSLETVYTAAEKTTACGYGCIGAMITACKNLGLNNSKILQYTTSYNVSQDKSTVVGYGAAVIQ
ncbi:MAG: AmmeMemoRadiSam system protein B [Candidatus Methanofastidiosia archaeon]|jgi:AmmeMemoRadiSam system protein B